MIIVDTSVVTHLYNETDLTKTAQKVLDKDPHWVLPPLWQEEYANVLSKFARKEGLSINEVVTHFKNNAKELKKCEVPVDTQRALQISIEYEISVYDACFIVLAKDFETLLVTEDKEVLKKCSKFSVSMKDFLSF